jgi:drug/metabolite transporter (DMT)-like permease
MSRVAGWRIRVIGQRRAAPAALGLAIGLWGSGFTPTEIALRSTSSATLNMLRTAPAAVLLVGALAVTQRLRWPSRADLRAALSGVLMIGVFTAAISAGTARAGAANTAVLLNTHPFWVFLLAGTFLGEKLSRRGVAGLVVGFAGVVMMIAPQASRPDSGVVIGGLAISLGGAVAWAVGTVVIRRAAATDEADIIQMTAIQYVAGALCLTVTAVALGPTAEWGRSSLWWSVAWLAIGAAALATAAFLYSLRHIDAVTASAFQFLVPVVAVVIELGRGHVPAPIVAAGMCVTVAGLFFVGIDPVRTAEATPTVSASSDAA